jgi:hypothetical protein
LGVLTAVVAAGLAVPAPAARADVLVNAPAASVSCRTGIEVGVWYQRHTGGPRWARIAIRTSSGRTAWRRSVTATTRWRFWRFHGACGRRYSVVYDTPGGRSRFTVRIRSR